MISPLHQTALDMPETIAIQQTDNGDKASIKHSDVISYLKLSALVTNLVRSLQKQGVSHNSRLACISLNNLEMICLYWACVDLGAIFLPISPKFPVSQQAQLCQRFKIDFYWSEAQQPDFNISDGTQQRLKIDLQLECEHPAPIQSKPSIDSKKPLNIILTSGSSGTPKGVVHCLSNHIASAQGSAEKISLKSGDTWLLSLPLFHIGGLAIINRCALAGACVVLSNNQPLWQQISGNEISHVSLVAAQLSKILAQHPQALDQVKALLLGGGAIEAKLVSALADRHINAYCSYGMSEMSSQITTALINPQGHLGKPLSHRQMEIRDGTIWVKGDCLFLGYLTVAVTDNTVPSHHQCIAEKVTDEQGWFNTQDLGELDDSGNLRLLGRADNMFICGGENIHPEEIEAALKAHPLIENALVFAEEDKTFSLLPAAIIQLKNSELSSQQTATVPVEAQLSTAQVNSIEQFILERIARFKRPRHYYSWPTGIKTTSLKIPRKAIIAAVKQRLPL
ncbi:o-succinylbenzoate--CoA ligase [Shewanella sp. 1_MG-2023]|uniref:o-succinylbenzoate--CoA ligase n=1 Tax=unclassified Shewanella TaxID=196818 RepID=UPI0026E29C9A|nr:MULTISPECIES: o-succinylbenzoate--CoA ligase [unclassified Shewanella]MDO6613759.1 o-succinylbenzoate--CoA ligase [Shewanella sp. 7_MG-2023]MDO6773539.1 o-succinylbenzoate--CoA ligase [Shewanella sp. 2_MG-2023]MDO6796524.1 o-succinylbenzoate--CoA ligase [Shewanella sp. 1_MG-2023]